MTAPTVSYLELLRRQPTFRRIWMGDVVSLMGDWFTTISLFALLLELTGRGEAVGVLIARFMPSLLFGPLAGVVADRLDRRTVMVTCDVLRALVVLGFLLIRTEADVPLAYLLAFVQLSLAAFFDPAEQAAVGSVVTREEIVTANALQGATWSAMLAIGALIGGLVAQLVGRDAAFVLNAVTYLGSACFMASARIPRQARPAQAPRSLRALVGYDDILEGTRFVLREPGVRRAILAKAGWGLAGGGAILLYSVFGERVFPLGEGAATGIAILYAARGVGALVGPTLARRFTREGERSLDRFIGLGFVLLALAYAVFGAAPWLWLAALALVAAHIGASTLWSFSTSLLNLRVPDRLRGRAFAADIALHTLTMSLSTWATGYGLDHLGISPRALMGILAAAMLLPAVAWRLLPAGPFPARAEGEPPAVAPKPEIAEPG